jgi:hypothetical protein
VVSNQITPKGDIYCASLFQHMAGPWVQPSQWRQDVRITATECVGEGGFLNCGVLIEGCQTVDEHVPSSNENGTYLLLDPGVHYDAKAAKWVVGGHRWVAGRPSQTRQVSAAAALATAAFGAPALRLHFLRRAQLPRVCGR